MINGHTHSANRSIYVLWSASERSLERVVNNLLVSTYEFCCERVVV